MTLLGRVELGRSGRSAELVATEDGLLLAAGLRDAWTLRGGRHALQRALPMMARLGVPVRVRIGPFGPFRIGRSLPAATA